METKQKTGEPTRNLMDGLLDEMNRCRDVVKEYEAIGRPGAIGAALIKLDIQKGEQAIREGDVVKMLIAYQSLKEIEL